MKLRAVPKFTAAVLLALVVTVFTGCAAIPKAQNAESSAIAITLDLDLYENLLNVRAFQPETVFFARIDTPDDFGKATKLLLSDYKDEHFTLSGPLRGAGEVDTFAMNVPPGTFAVVAASDREGHVVFFPEDAIKASAVTVKPGTMIYAGRFEFERVNFYKKELDPAQQHYYQGIMSSSFRKLTRRPYAAGSVKKVTRNEKEFLSEHRNTFKNSEWATAIENRLRELN